jgi:hypothetical protein
MSNYITIKLRRGTQAQWAATNPVLAEGEFGAETDTRKFKIGNGVTAWNALSYWGSAGGGAADFTDLGDVPASYSGQAGKFVKVKSDESGLEFGTLTIAASDLPSGIDAAKIGNGSVSNTEFQYLDGATSNIQTQINGKANTVHTHNIADVTGLQTALDNKVPYSGASGDVNLGEYGAQLGNIEFDNTPTNTPSTDGSIFWDSGDGTLQLQMKGGSVQKVGMNTFARVYNDSGVQLVKGDVIYISGAQGNRIAAKKAQANSEATSKGTLGFVVETIAAGAEGVVITEGPLYNLTTTGLTAGQTLYLSATTAGAYTTTAPQAPDHIVILATVERVHASAGSIYVKISNGYELDELHDVDTTKSKATPVDADALLLQDSADSSIWKRLTWANLKATAKTYFDTLYAAVVHTHVIGDVTNLQTTLDGKVDENAAITGATKTKITYDAKGLVTAGADATTADIADSSNKRYVTDAQLTVLGNTSGTNTGDQTITLTGDVTGSGTGSFAATIANKAVTYAKIQDVSATSRLLGRKTAGAGSAEELTASEALDFIGSTRGQVLYRGATGWAVLNPGTSGQYLKTGGAGADPSWDSPAGGVSDGDKGDITVSSSGTVWTVDSKAISLAKIQDIGTSRILGRVTASTGVTEELTGTQATTLLDTFTSSLKGLAPASGGGTTNFLRADGTWAAPQGGGGGTVLSPSQITSWQNNYNPTSWGSGVQTLRLDGNSSFNFLTGLTATTGGHRVKLMNVGSNPIGLLDASGSSTAANRFEFAGRDLVILPGRTIELEYDSTSSRWRSANVVNIWAEAGEWVNFDRVELYHRNVSNIAAHHLAYVTATGTAAENNGGTSGIRPRVGVVTLGTGTSTSSRALVAPAAQNYRMYAFHDGTSYVNYHYFETSVRLSALSDAADIYSLKLGWLNSDSASSIGAETNGLFLMYRHNLNSGNWVLRGLNNTTATDGNSSSAVAASTWYRIRIIAYPDGTAAAWVNGTQVATIASGLPGSGQDCAPMALIRKEGGTTGTNARNFDIDYMGIGTIYNSAR